MKTLFQIILISIVSLFVINYFNNKHIQTSYDEFGTKIVYVTCVYQENCLQDIGNECGDLGYVLIEKTESKITAKCGNELQFIDYFEKKIIKILSLF